MKGYINSERQANIIDFLERVGPCPLPALEVLFGKRTRKALKSIRGAGYAYSVKIDDEIFWVPDGYGRFDIKQQTARGWAAVKEEKDEVYEDNTHEDNSTNSPHENILPSSWGNMKSMRQQMNNETDPAKKAELKLKFDQAKQEVEKKRAQLSSK